MTNAQIVFNESVRLMDEGVIGSTGNQFTFEDADGKEVTIDEPEQIHTYQGWKSLGYKVKRGEKAIAKFPIWKYTEKKKDEKELTGNPLNDAPVTNMFMKMSCWFKKSQVEAI